MVIILSPISFLDLYKEVSVTPTVSQGVWLMIPEMILGVRPIFLF